MSDVYTLVQTALVTKLAAHSGITADGARIAELPAPDSFAYPFYTFLLYAGGDRNDSPRRAIELVYLIECWSDDLSVAQVGAGYIDEALHNSELIISGWSNWRLQNDGFKTLPDELLAGQIIRRRGSLYRVSIASNT